MHLHPSREEAKPTERVSQRIHRFWDWSDSRCSAKYIEGLENRLGRMETLLRLSGLLSDNDSEAMDLQTLEKRLVEKKRADREQDGDSSSRNSSPEQDTDETPSASRATSADEPKEKTPNEKRKAPNGKAKKRKGEGEEEEVEAISEAMCSLVTNDCGETRYIGRFS
jgi:hypothetical protein